MAGVGTGQTDGSQGVSIMWTAWCHMAAAADGRKVSAVSRQLQALILKQILGFELLYLSKKYFKGPRRWFSE